MNPAISAVLHEKKVIVCCGAGGVGKTTVSAALALAAARAGRRVLVVTIDPSKRLAETLGVQRNAREPIRLSAERLEAAGVQGDLWAWMLDPKQVSDDVVRAFSKTEAQGRRLLENPIYRNVTAMVAGMQEYTAVEALHGFVQSGRYDLVILDTPPSRDALRFLEAPVRASAFLDRRIFNLFVPGEGGMIKRVATKLLERVMDAAFGKNTRVQLQEFFELFGALLGHLNRNQTEMRGFFSDPSVGFMLVTAPTQDALSEAMFFEQKTEQVLGMHVSGYVLNRSLARRAGARVATPEDLDAGVDDVTRRAVVKLEPLAERERLLVDGHMELASQLIDHAGEAGMVWVAPAMPEGVNTLPQLISLADAMLDAKGDAAQ
jgi:anion-transporting  ArsA/GET3 family ATPase